MMGDAIDGHQQTTPRDFIRWRKKQADVAAQAARFDFMGDAKPVDVVRERARGNAFLKHVNAFGKSDWSLGK